jgi:hypothetical protein
MTIELSGLCYPNKMARIYCLSIEKTIGGAAMQKVYELAQFPPADCPPTNNLAKEFDFAYFSELNKALYQMYGERGERSLTIKAARDAYVGGLSAYAPLIGVSDIAMKPLSVSVKLKVGLKAMAETYNKFSDQRVTVADEGDYFNYTIESCPVCLGRTHPKPVCYAAVSLLEAGMQWVSGGKHFRIEETQCHAMGDAACVFHIWKEPIANS